jgi:L-fuculose-phosphate aldolase
MTEGTLRAFQTIGADIFQRGLISSHAGNLSIRAGNRILLTRRGSMLGHLAEKDIVELPLDGDDSQVLMASSEVVVHKAIYKNTSALAVVHAHPPYATLLSMIQDEIIPVDSEGSYLFKKIPVVSTETTIGSREASVVISDYLREYKLVMLRGHGSFARGDMLEEAYLLTSSLEASAFFVYHLRDVNKEYRKYSEKYKDW